MSHGDSADGGIRDGQGTGRPGGRAAGAGFLAGPGEQGQRQTAPPWRLSIGNRPSLVADGGAGGSGKGRGGGRSGSGRGGSRTRGRGPPPRRPFLAGSGGDVHNGRRRHWR